VRGGAATAKLIPGGRMEDPSAQYVWHEGPVPAGLPVTQVSGWLICPLTGRVLIQEQDDGTFNLPGGTPESHDAGQYATLAREAFEENQVRIAPAAAYLGYQEVRQPGRPVIAQVRMAGIITQFAPRAPDPDNGRLNRRYMTSLAAAPGVLGWGLPAEAQAQGAARIARQWGMPVDTPAADGYED
jgi:8-oxo-dGTP pyrophosphatase MutT (NUDIX family)